MSSIYRVTDPIIDSALAGSFLASFPTDILERLLADAGHFILPAGTTTRSDPAQLPRLALVLDGLSRLYLMSPEGRQVTVRYMRPGDVVGTAAFVSGPSPVNFQAPTDCTALFFNTQAFRAVARTNCSLGDGGRA